MRSGPASFAMFSALALLLSGCDQPAETPVEEPPQELAIHQPAIGSNEIFREATAAAQGHELIVADLLLPPNAIGAAHSHPWEEYLYILGGSATLDIEGMEPRALKAGESFIIPRETVHIPRAGPDGIRAIIVRVHDEGDPVMVPVETQAEPQAEPQEQEQ